MQWGGDINSIRQAKEARLKRCNGEISIASGRLRKLALRDAKTDHKLECGVVEVLEISRRECYLL